MNWSDVLTRKGLRELAGNRSFSAGEDYAAEGAVTGLLTGERTLTAFAQGTARYRVCLEFDESGGLRGDCSCPYGEEGNFCKHCVAVGIAWLESANDPNASSRPTTTASLQAYLQTLAQAELIALLMEQVAQNAELQNQLLLKMAETSPDGPDIATYQKAIERAFRIGGSLDYDEVHDYADGIRTVTDSLEGLLAKGFAVETRCLVEYALEELAEPMQRVDDSSGFVGEVWQNLHTLHLGATLEAPGDPETLAEWLFQREMNADFDLSNRAE